MAGPLQYDMIAQIIESWDPATYSLAPMPCPEVSCDGAGSDSAASPSDSCGPNKACMPLSFCRSCGGESMRQCREEESGRPCGYGMYPTTMGLCQPHCGEEGNQCCTERVVTGDLIYTGNSALGDDGCYTYNSQNGIICVDNVCRDIGSPNN
jgi:hypothetical protein